MRNLGPEQRAQLDAAIEASAQQGERLSAVDYLQAEARPIELAEHLARYHRRFDLRITPTIAGVAPQHDTPDALAQLGQRAPFAGAFSLTRQPAISVPIGISASGLPLGIQIVGRHFEDARVLAAARAFERSPEAQAFRARAAALRARERVWLMVTRYVAGRQGLRRRANRVSPIRTAGGTVHDY